MSSMENQEQHEQHEYDGYNRNNSKPSEMSLNDDKYSAIQHRETPLDHRNEERSIVQTPEQIAMRQSQLQQQRQPNQQQSQLNKQSAILPGSLDLNKYMDIIQNEDLKQNDGDQSNSNTTKQYNNELDRFYFSKDKFPPSSSQQKDEMNQSNEDEVKINSERDNSNMNIKYTNSQTNNEQEIIIQEASDKKIDKIVEKQQHIQPTQDHVDTSPRKMASIREDHDNIKPSMILKNLPEGEEQENVEYGSNTQRVMNLEKKFGGYTMISRLFSYDDLRMKPDFQILQFRDAMFRGQIKNGDRREGLGVMIYESGRIYEGEWLNDRRHGKGYERYSNGNTYEGEFQRGKANGFGIYRWRNGEIYEGDWLNGFKHGKGTWKNNFGKRYSGDWMDNKANGKGEHVWSTGDRYVGDWMDFLKHGYGTDYFANEDEYSGQYRYGKPWGKGRYKWASGAVYEGDFEDGKKQGKGRWEKVQLFDGKEVLVYYEGDYRNDAKEGYGEYKWASGNFYKGYYKNDKRHFYGEMYWNDGSIYKGEWYDGVQHGYGIMSFATGEQKEGLFINGVFKMEGGEQEIKQYMRKHKIQSSDMDMTQSSKQLSTDSYHSNNSKNVKFKSNSKHRNAGDQYSGSFASGNNRSNSKKIPIQVGAKGGKQGQSLKKNESAPQLHNLKKIPLTSSQQSPHSINHSPMQDSLQFNSQNSQYQSQSNMKYLPRQQYQQQQQQHLLPPQKQASSERKIFGQRIDSNVSNFGLSHITEQSSEYNTKNHPSVIEYMGAGGSGLRQGVSHYPNGAGHNQKFLPSIDDRYKNKFQSNSAQNRNFERKSSHSEDHAQLGQIIRNQKFIGGGGFNPNNSQIRGQSSQSYLREVQKQVRNIRPWIPSGVVHRNDGLTANSKIPLI